MLPFAPAYLPVPPVTASSESPASRNGPSTVIWPAFKVQRPKAFPALAHHGAHAVALIAADLRLVGGVIDLIGEHQQIADGVALVAAEMQGGFAHRTLDDGELLAGKRRQRHQRGGERQHPNR